MFGPNPKYYSLFYYKDEEFIDLTNLSIHDEAYLIDQKPVRHQFYLNSSQAEQKESAYGWINLEDQDIKIEKGDGELRQINFHRISSEKRILQFALEIQFANATKYYHGKIIASVVYSEKQRSFVVEKSEEMGNIKQKVQYGSGNTSQVRISLRLLTKKSNSCHKHLSLTYWSNLSTWSWSTSFSY